MRNEGVALVTGGAGGMGAAICGRLAAAGWRVAVGDLKMESAAQTADAVGGLAVAVDVRDPGSVAGAVASIAAEAGPIGALVNCAGWEVLMPFTETDESLQAELLEINLSGPIRITRAVLPMMLEMGGGTIVNIASDAGRLGSPLEVIYSAAKGGLIAFTKAIAREYAARGVNANAVCPGPTDTPLLHDSLAASEDAARMIASMTKAIPMRRIGTPEDIAAAVEFLASPAASYITGQVVSVSGGLSMQ